MVKVLQEAKKYPYFITEQSASIPHDLICYAETVIKRSDTLFKINECVNSITIAMDIEKGIFEYSLLYIISNNLLKQLFTSIYNHKIDDIINNMKNNPEIISDIHENRIKPKMIAFMSPSQLFPKKWEQLLAKKQIKEEKENNLPTTDIYKCRKCEQRKCTVAFLQTRSIDEPMTTFIRCCNCYNTWTM